MASSPIDSSEGALLRYPGVGGHDGHACTCTSACPAACDGDRCGCAACERAWIDAGMDELIATTWRAWKEADAADA